MNNSGFICHSMNSQGIGQKVMTCAVSPSQVGFCGELHFQIANSGYNTLVLKQIFISIHLRLSMNNSNNKLHQVSDRLYNASLYHSPGLILL